MNDAAPRRSAVRRLDDRRKPRDPGGTGPVPRASPAAEAWRTTMRDWVVPEEILAAAAESPWGFPVELFRSRAERAVPASPGYSLRRAAEALPPQGTVLDVGAGGGAASLPLSAGCALIVAVDPSADLLAVFRREARRRGVRARTVRGEWPAVARRSPVADVVVCHHVAYNVADLAPFAAALTAHARRRVVMELTDRHPAAWMADLWRRFHGLARPTRPDADDALAVLRELGLDVHRHRAIRPHRPGGFERPEDAVAWIRRRLCLPAERDADVAAALGDRLSREDGLWSVRPPVEPVVTLWWDPARAAG